MSDTKATARGNDERMILVEQGMKGMRDAAQRMKEDLNKAPRKNNPRQYADSAIGDAEYVMLGHLKSATESLDGMQFVVKGSAHHSLGGRLHEAEAECASYVLVSRAAVRELWRLPTD